MKTISVTKTRSNLYKLIDEIRESSQPIQIIGKRGNAILFFEDDWRAIQETLYLLSISRYARIDSGRSGNATGRMF